MIPYHWLKNIGLGLLVSIQLVSMLIAWHQIERDQHALTLINNQLTRRFEILSRLERLNHEAYSLFVYDMTEDFVTVDNVNDLVGNLCSVVHYLPPVSETFSERLQQLDHHLDTILVALPLLDSTRDQFISDTNQLQNRINDEFAQLFDLEATLYQHQVAIRQETIANRLETVDNLTQIAEETFQRYINTPIHQPKTIVHLLRDLEKSLEQLQTDRFPGCHASDLSCRQINTIRNHLNKICTNLPGVYQLWQYDPNLSYLGDEVKSLNESWDAIQSALNVLLHTEKQHLNDEISLLSEQMSRGKIKFALLALFGFATALFFTVLLSRSLHSRLNRVVIGIQEFSRGNRSYRLDITSQDLIASVADEFNTMADQLYSQEQRLQQSQQLLEQRVVERTSELQQANERLVLMDQVFRNAREAILVLNAEGKIIQVNPEFIRLTGFEKDHIIGRHPGLFKQATENTGIQRRLPNNSVTLWEGEIVLNHADRSAIPCWVSVSSFENHAGAVSGFIAIFHDLRKIKEQEEQIRHQALHDPLTGLPNRMLMADRLSIAIAQAKRNNRKVGVLFLDLDNFKKINDSLGHSVGDDLLIAMAGQLQNTFRDDDTVCRLGGEEFIVILGNITAVTSIYDLAERLLQRLSIPLQLQRHSLQISTSIGIAIYPDNGTSVNELLKNADMAMYAAKEKGKNTISTFSTAMNETLQKRLSLETAIRDALKMDQFEVYYQPQMSTDGCQLWGAEGLVRWKDPQRGLIPPNEFIPLCEETGLIQKLGEVVIRQIFTFAARFCNQPCYQNCRFSVNVSPRQFADPQFLDLIKSELRHTGVRPENIEIEITESSMMQDLNHTRTLLKELRALGLSIAIDDFGTGYSSLNHLKHFPIQTLKIDRSFIKDIPQNKDDLQLVKTIISMAHHLGITLVAEGVETEAQQGVLHRLGCQTIQGFLFSRPLCQEDFEDFCMSAVRTGQRD
nr:EAL domain-containing protein [uncultured Desulfuromonas sp.]